MSQAKNSNRLFLACLTAIAILFAGCKDKKDPFVDPGKTADPQWAITVENDMSSSMTVVVDVTIPDAEGILAAFIGEECCGIASSTEGLYMLYISAPEAGSTVTLKFYSPSLRRIYTAKETLAYKADEIIGSVDSPYTPTWQATRR